MTRKIADAVLLLLCFGALAILSGAVPVLADEDASAELFAEAPQPIAEESPAPTPSPGAEDIIDPDPTDTPSPTETPAPDGSWAEDVAVLSTTITGDELIDNDTYYDIDPQALLAEGCNLSLPAEGYQILIIHTHATEAYTPAGDDIYTPTDDYRTTDTAYSVVRVGEALTRALESYGLRVLHDASLYDYPSYNGSYSRCGAAIEEYLAAYPTIQLVIDLHRDAIGDGDTIYKTVTEVEGVQAAQMLFVMGSDVNLENPNWQENLKLALTLQTAVQSRWKHLMRPTTLCDYRYNQQLSPGSLLLEVGTAGNTLEEAINAVKLFADAVGGLLVEAVKG